jgi:hypothetical protein
MHPERLFRHVAVTAAACLIGASAFASQQPPAAAPPPPGPGLELVNERCGFCHTTNQVFAARKTAAEWPGVVQSMIDRGAELSPEEQKTMTDYLAAHFATDAAPAAQAH